MRYISLAAALAALAFAGMMATASADNYYGPRQVGNQCWHHNLGNSLGYWATCEKPKSAQVIRTNTKKK